MMAPSLGLLYSFHLLVVGALAVANYPAVPSDLTTPVQQRLAIKGPDTISVGWNTYKKLDRSCVEFGLSSDCLDVEVCSSHSRTYNTSRTYANEVSYSGLEPGTTYYYKIVSTNSSVEHFKSPLPAGDPEPFNIDVVIDLGVYGVNGFTTKKRDTIPYVQPELNHSTIARLADTVDQYDFVIHPGDIAYADDWFFTDGQDEGTYQAIIEQFYDQLAPVAGRKPYMVSPGNHEAVCDEIPFLIESLCPGGQKNFTDFMTRFSRTMPTAFPSSSKNREAQRQAHSARKLAKPPFWYSFEYGMAHITMIDTETDFPDAPDQPGGFAALNAGPFGFSGQQLQFLEADLKSVDRTKTPWVIVAGHRPWYTTGSGQCGPCQKAFEGLFYKYGVDLGIFGHVHNSQRFLPVYNKTADPAGMNDPVAPMYIVAGGAGNIEGLSGVGANYSTNTFVYASNFSYATIKFQDRQHLGVDFIDSYSGTVVDSSVLFKSHDKQFVVNS